MDRIRGSGIRAGGTLEEMATEALCNSQKAMDRVRISVDQMRESQKRGSQCVEAGNAKLDAIDQKMNDMVQILDRIATALEGQEELVRRQEVAASELRSELRAGRAASGGAGA